MEQALWRQFHSNFGVKITPLFLLCVFDACAAQNLDGCLFLPPITGVSGQHCTIFRRLPSRLVPPTILDRGAPHITLETFSSPSKEQ